MSLTNKDTTLSKQVVEIYQLAPDPESLMQSYVIKTFNGKLIVIDGGISGPAANQEIYLLSALRAIVGVEEGEYFEVEAWFLSHPHNDHFFELAKMLNTYTGDSNYKINHLYFDFPPFETPGFPYSDGEFDAMEKLKSGLSNYATVNKIEIPQGSTYYDELNGSVINKASVKDGLAFEIDGVAFEILLTWDVSRGSDANNQSLIIKMFACGQTVLFLNDCQVAEGNDLLKYCPHKIKSDIVQMAHHGQDGVGKEVYAAIAAKVHLWPTPRWVWNNTVDFTIGETRRWVNGSDFTQANKYNLVACLYDAYPTNRASVDDWRSVKDSMKIILSYRR